MAGKPIVRFGLKNVHYAVITENEDGAITYAKPVALNGAINLVLNAKGDKAELFADDKLYYASYANQGYDGTLELAFVPDSFKVDVLNYRTDGNGVLFEDANAVFKKIALLFEFNTDRNSIRRAMYKVDVSRPNFETSSKTQTIEPKTSTLNLTISPLDNGLIMAKADASLSCYNTWYDTVYQYVEPTKTISLNMMEN